MTYTLLCYSFIYGMPAVKKQIISLCFPISFHPLHRLFYIEIKFI